MLSVQLQDCSTAAVGCGLLREMQWPPSHWVTARTRHEQVPFDLGSQLEEFVKQLPNLRGDRAAVD